MVLIIDNYDSFTYNLVQVLGEIDPTLPVTVFRNDKITVQEIEEMNPQKIIISPGPSRPENAGISVPLIQQLGRRKPILGVCLGHQALGVAYGATVTYARNLMHGKLSKIIHDGQGLYKGLSAPFMATRYHSLILAEDTIPFCLKVTAVTESQEIMGVRHRTYPVEGVQFHPESILTEHGRTILENFLGY